MDEHVTEVLGKTRVLVRSGKVVEVGEPKIDYCPLFDKYRGIKKLNRDSIQKNIEFRIKDFGMCTKDRVLKMKDFLSFGISETLGTLLEDQIIDCAVIVCEGCGTVIIKDPQLVQGIGGRISGFLNTTPIEEIIDAVGRGNVLDTSSGRIDQVEGALKAIDQGHKKIGVTVVSSEDAKKLREMEKNYKDVRIYIFVVHVTGVSKEEAEALFRHADVITACASLHIRKIGDERKFFKVGVSIPIYGVTKKGKYFLQRRIERIGGLKEKKHAKIPEPLI